jgi:hypothetical protein
MNSRALTCFNNQYRCDFEWSDPKLDVHIYRNGERVGGVLFRNDAGWPDEECIEHCFCEVRILIEQALFEPQTQPQEHLREEMMDAFSDAIKTLQGGPALELG